LDLKLRAVKLYLEEGYPAELVAQELGIGNSTLTGWAKRYREQGEAGLQPSAPRKGTPKVSAAVKQEAVALKRKHPEYGSRRISDLLKRMFCLGASAETVRQTLKAEDLVEPPKRKRRKNPSRPRFFERARPNQLWQSDIFTFRLGGRNAYLIGYLDDYSRYVAGLALRRSQTAEHVLEAYRRAIAEYGVPKEMLTDNGRQYTNWRGTTRFEHELKKDRVAHIKSRPHHPMTLGKIERFWKTIFTEFLCRVQFDSFEEAQERLRLWMKYYNHKRPHQGIGGLCPADRYYEIQSELRKVIERGIEENVLESALRGQPKKPFYMVGRMGDQSVVIRAEKGKVKMSVDGPEDQKEKELVYDVQKHEAGEESRNGAQGEAGVQCEDQMRSGPVGVGGAPEALGSVQGAGDTVGKPEPLAEPGIGGDDLGAGASDTGGGAQPGVGAEAGETAREDASADGEAHETGEKTRKDPVEHANGDDVGLGDMPPNGVILLSKEQVPIVVELLRKMEEARTCNESEATGSGDAQTGAGSASSRTDLESAQRGDDGLGGGEGFGRESQDILQMGETGSGGDAREPLRAQLGPSRFGARRGEGELEEEGQGVGEGAAVETTERRSAELVEV
jgi:transposase InsO family protein